MRKWLQQLARPDDSVLWWLVAVVVGFVIVGGVLAWRARRSGTE